MDVARRRVFLQTNGLDWGVASRRSSTSSCNRSLIPTPAVSCRINSSCQTNCPHRQLSIIDWILHGEAKRQGWKILPWYSEYKLTPFPYSLRVWSEPALGRSTSLPSTKLFSTLFLFYASFTTHYYLGKLPSKFLIRVQIDFCHSLSKTVQIIHQLFNANTILF